MDVNCVKPWVSIGQRLVKGQAKFVENTEDSKIEGKPEGRANFGDKNHTATYSQGDEGDVPISAHEPGQDRRDVQHNAHVQGHLVEGIPAYHLPGVAVAQY